MSLLGMDNRPLRNYWNNEKKRRRTRKLKKMARNLHNPKNNNVMTNLPSRHGMNLGNNKNRNSMRSNNLGKTPPKLNE